MEAYMWTRKISFLFEEDFEEASPVMVPNPLPPLGMKPRPPMLHIPHFEPPPPTPRPLFLFEFGASPQLPPQPKQPAVQEPGKRQRRRKIWDDYEPEAVVPETGIVRTGGLAVGAGVAKQNKAPKKSGANAWPAVALRHTESGASLATKSESCNTVAAKTAVTTPQLEAPLVTGGSILEIILSATWDEQQRQQACSDVSLQQFLAGQSFKEERETAESKKRVHRESAQCGVDLTGLVTAFFSLFEDEEEVEEAEQRGSVDYDSSFQSRPSLCVAKACAECAKGMPKALPFSRYIEDSGMPAKVGTRVPPRLASQKALTFASPMSVLTPPISEKSDGSPFPSAVY